MSLLRGAFADARFVLDATGPARVKDSPSSVPDLPEEKFVELPGRGSGLVRLVSGPDGATPLVLLHGWSWTADLNFSAAFTPLSKTHRVIAPDIRLHGRGLRAEGTFEVTDATDDVIALLDVLGVDRALLAGFSLGGLLCVDAAVRYPDRVAGIVVGSAAAYYSDFRRERAVFAAMRLLNAFGTRAATWNLSSRYFHRSLRQYPELAIRWQWVCAELARASVAEVVTVGAAVSRADLRPALGRGVSCPVEYLLFTRDRVCRPALQIELATRLEARIVEVDADHDLPVANPPAFAELLVEAVQRLERSRSS